MPFSSGTFSLFTPGNPVVTGTTISSTWGNNTLSDIATGLSTCMLKNGTQTMTANLPMAGFKVTGLGAATTAGDALRYEQLINVYLPLAGGTLVGDLLFTDNLYDIGKSAATRPRDGFFSRNFVIGGTLNVTGHVTLEGVTSTGATGTGLLVFGTTPTLTTAILGSSTATTQTAGDNSTKVATTAYVEGRMINGTATATTSGTAVGFTGIPSWVKRFYFSLNAVSTNGTSIPILQVGSGSYTTSGYTGAVAGGTSGNTFSASAPTTGIGLGGATDAATTQRFGTITFVLFEASTNTWVYSGTIGGTTAANGGYFVGGTIALSGALDRIQITATNGTDAFDNGKINIQY